ncbi:uncharacterized protein [Miscanthus floridulus]|uniref:uncharacterized protein n=1 Tax=Miscanthus floridulus TaxID=154761 RepID=UPI003458B1B0
MDETTTGDLRWHQGWLDGGGMPPGLVLGLSSIVAFFLYLTWQIDGFCVLLLLGLLALVLLAHHALFDADGRIVVAPAAFWWWGQSEGGASSDTDRGSSGTSPWAVAAVVALLMVLALHKSSFQMFRPPFYLK